MQATHASFFIPVCLAVYTTQALADTVLTVGPTGQYRTISDAVTAANVDSNPNEYYVIKVTPWTYTNDFPHVTRSMTIEVDPNYKGQEVLLKATIDLPNRKGIILTDASLTVDGLTFTGAKIANSLGGNGAGIRDQNTGSPASLIVRNSTFTGNQEGILTGANAAKTITIVNSKFVNNGNPDLTGPPYCCQHALYVGQAGSLTVSNSLFCGQLIGHDIKSRAMVTSVSNSLLYDGAANQEFGCRAGSTSFAIDVPNGGVATISGNQIIQGAATQNSILIAYGEEGLLYNDNRASLTGNHLTNSGASAIGIYNRYCVPLQLVNNTFSGITTPVFPPKCAVYQEKPSIGLAAAKWQAVAWDCG